MITLKKLKVYARYGGDVDSWARVADSKIINDSEWAIISSLLQDCGIIKAGLASNEYIAGFEKKLADHFEDSASIDYFKSIDKY